MLFLEIINAAAAIGTAIGACLAGYQIRLGKEQAKTSFEDSMTQQYREIIKCIPVKALLKGDLDGEEYQRAKDDFYRYFDLCNEQIHLRQNNRVSKKTWGFWCDGIKSNLDRSAFKKAWKEIERTSGDDFSELKRLLRASGNENDPANW